MQISSKEHSDGDETEATAYALYCVELGIIFDWPEHDNSVFEETILKKIYIHLVILLTTHLFSSIRYFLT